MGIEGNKNTTGYVVSGPFLDKTMACKILTCTEHNFFSSFVSVIGGTLHMQCFPKSRPITKRLSRIQIEKIGYY